MPRTCLLVEDDFVLRSTMQSMLEALGVTDIAAFDNERDALEFLSDGATLGFALIDYRLGRLSTTESVALELLRRGVPMVFATGLGELSEINSALAGVPVLEKPVRPEALRPYLVDTGLL